MIKVKDINHLKEICCDDDQRDFVVALNFGGRSSKMIWYWKSSNTFQICNEIDWTYEEDLTEEEFMKTITGEALAAGALWWDEELAN